MLPNPPHPNSAVFAVAEEDALNFSRFVISGPVDTPYEGGLFVFDVFLPPNYPADPPLVQIVTTGQGTVRWVVTSVVAEVLEGVLSPPAQGGHMLLLVVSLVGKDREPLKGARPTVISYVW